jgi:hypothetical protein
VVQKQMSAKGKSGHRAGLFYHLGDAPRRALVAKFLRYHPTAFGRTAIIYILSCSRGGMINAILTLCGPASFMRY